ncbi:MAG: signal recognition particle-docking protein FtsY [Planctomycetota bacterium]
MIFGKVLDKLKQSLSKTRNLLNTNITELLRGRTIDENLLNQLEETMIASDLGVETSLKIIEDLKTVYREGKLTDPGKIIGHLKTELKTSLQETKGRSRTALNLASAPPTVILVTGVNGTGKTTSIAKLAYLLQQDGKKILLAASDTFRAAAIEQLSIWGERVGVEIVRHQSGADPGAVAFDAAEAALARQMDFLIVDTAGRLHTKTNLMKELTKIKNILAKKIPGAPHETLLVLDATTGQNAIAQAKVFNEAVPLTGLFLAKLDGTAKGGIVVAIKNQLNIPVKFIGLGEKQDDIEPFDADKFVEALFAE